MRRREAASLREAEHFVANVSDREVPFDDKDGIYRKMVGHRYYVRSRGGSASDGLNPPMAHRSGHG
jgi:hypothetical protein